jgi:hypothetical protein
MSRRIGTGTAQVSYASAALAIATVVFGWIEPKAGS